jgi:hypothetical protein
MVLATFSSVFPCVSLWQTHTGDVVLIGSAEPPRTNPDQLVARLLQPTVKANLDQLGLANPVVFLSHEIVSPAVGALIPATDTPVHSDLYPVLEYAAQRDFFVRRSARRFRQVDENFSRRPATLLGQYLQQHPLTPQDCATFARFNLAEERASADLVPSVLLRWQQAAPDAWEPREMASRFKTTALPGEWDALRLEPLRDRLRERARTNSTLFRHYGLSLMRAYLGQRSCFYAPPTEDLVHVLKSLVLCDPDNQRLYQAYLAELAWDRGDDETCLALARLALLSDLPRGVNKFQLDPAAQLLTVTRIADVQRRRGELKAAAALCELAVKNGDLNDDRRYDALPFEVAQRRVLAELALQAKGPVADTAIGTPKAEPTR